MAELAMLVAVFAFAACTSISVPAGSTRARIAASIPLLDPIHKIPPEQSLERLLSPSQPWLEGTAAHTFGDYQAVRESVVAHRNSAPTAASPTARGTPIAEFLHVSDAQVRDEGLHRDAEHMRQLRNLDGLIRVTLRNSNVEQIDSLILAAQLAAYAKSPLNCTGNEATHRFIVHTGDLIDTSVVTELMTTLAILNAVQKASSCDIYSVAGNHDGLTFGNLPDAATDTRGLGINRSEFVLGHFFFDEPRTDAFGLANNEIIVAAEDALRRNVPPKKIVGTCDDQEHFRCDEGAKGWCGCVREQIKDTAKSLHVAKRDGCAEMPGAFREAIHVSSIPDSEGVQLGYYSILPKEDAEFPTRLVMLDTRHASAAGGDIDLVQLGWLYRELRSAMRNRELVLVFAHHEPDEIGGSHGRIFRRMLDGFPNIAGYFYGHSHWNEAKQYDEDRFWMFQTGSLVDYPQVARDVRVYAERRDAEKVRVTVSWYFWRPKGSSSSGGLALNGLLHAARRDSRKEHNSSLWWPFYLFASEGEKGARADRRDSLFRKRFLGPGSQDVILQLDGCDVPSAKDIFGDELQEVDYRRRTLALPPIPGKPACVAGAASATSKTSARK